MTLFSFYLPEPQLRALREMKEATQISVSEHIRYAIRDYLAFHYRDGSYRNIPEYDGGEPTGGRDAPGQDHS